MLNLIIGKVDISHHINFALHGIKLYNYLLVVTIFGELKNNIASLLHDKLLTLVEEIITEES